MLKKISFIIAALLLTPPLAGQSALERVLDPGNLPLLKRSRMVQVSSHDTSGGNNDRINIHAGKTAGILNMEGPGVITRIWVTIDSRDPWFLRRILLRMYWDGEPEPSVEVPVGDFFGTGFEYRHYLSAFTGMSSGGYYCYFPMPFQRSARIEAVNETGQEVYAFYYQIDVQQLREPLSEDIAYFHAQWRRDPRTSPDSNYTVLEARGRGHFVGLNMSMQGYAGGLGFLEGDEMVWVDGEASPSVYGTGTEDFFTGGWYFRNGEFAGQYHGMILKDDSLSRIAAYRYQVGDAIPFEQSLKFTIEHGHDNSEICDYASTAFWYQKEPHAPFPPLPTAAMRIPLRYQVPPGGIEMEEMEIVSDDPVADSENMTMFGPEWSGGAQLTLRFSGAGGSVEVPVPAGEERRYTGDLYYTRGPEYGIVTISHNGREIGRIDGYAESVRYGGRIRFDGLEPDSDGTIILTVTAAGTDAETAGHGAGLDMIMLHPVREYIPVWNVIGPFPNRRLSDAERFGLDTVFPPEQEIDLTKTYRGANGQEASWQRLETPASGYFSLWHLFDPYEFIVTYAQTWIYSSEAQTVPLLIGSDDGSKVFLNGHELYRFLAVRIAAPDQDRIRLHLKKGWNSLLLKIENNFGGYAFYARVIDRRGDLTFSTDKKRN